MSVLDDICAKKREYIAAQKMRMPLPVLQQQAQDASPVRGFAQALKTALRKANRV